MNLHHEMKVCVSPPISLTFHEIEIGWKGSSRLMNLPDPLKSRMMGGIILVNETTWPMTK